jgi:hypothetical protein
MTRQACDTKKQSFFEKKDQKTFSMAVAGFSCEVRDSIDKSLLLLFFRKEGLSFAEDY